MNRWGCLGPYAHNSPDGTPPNGAVKPSQIVRNQIWRESGLGSGSRSIPEETAVALTYNGGTYAVMMATPLDLEDFAVGFSLNEGVIGSAADIDTLDVLRLDDGVELRMWLSKPKAERLQARRRHVAGPTGCGLCGIESIAEAMRPAAVIGRGAQFSPEQIMLAMQSVPPRQKLNMETRAVHAAAFWNTASGIVALREDVGRHNALDKLSGAMARTSTAAGEGVILLTSRVSVEMVQKSAAIGAPVMVSVSAPTALAVRMADAAGITLAAIARADGFEVFTHFRRISHGVAEAMTR
ncbi:MAG: formate dehydrogenase family accessory protein FdhD [Acidobacteria bacterium]|nr:formate dehydrogenase family accessory protein FdhD [Acidobacteriota bacterium]